MRDYIDYMNNQPMTDGMEIRSFFEEDEMEMNIKESQAREFWRDLMGTLRYSTKESHGIMSVGLIADYMNISVEKANAFLRRCAEDDLRLTERQGGGWVV